MISTLVGRSGRSYKREKVLKSDPEDAAFDVYLGRCEGHPYVLKHSSPSIFELCLEHEREFPDGARLRIHIDYNLEEQTLVYEYFRDDLLALVKNNPDFPLEARKQILRETGKALKLLHDKDWIHIDIKPDNIMIDWNLDKQGQVKIERVALTDLDCSLKLIGDRLLRLPGAQRIGNFMWRSPEGHTGLGIGKPSDIFAYGLVCLYTITGVETLYANRKALESAGETPEMEILTRLLIFFSPLPDGLVKHTDDKTWGDLLTDLSKLVGDTDPSSHFDQWQEEDFPDLDVGTKRMLSKMLRLDPAERSTIDEVLEDRWWLLQLKVIGSIEKLERVDGQTNEIWK